MQTIINSECQNPQTMTGSNTAVYTARHVNAERWGTVCVQLFFIIISIWQVLCQSTGARKVSYFTYIMALFHMTKKGHYETSLRSVCPVCVGLHQALSYDSVSYMVVLSLSSWGGGGDLRHDCDCWGSSFPSIPHSNTSQSCFTSDSLSSEQNEAHHRRSYYTSQVKTSA